MLFSEKKHKTAEQNAEYETLYVKMCLLIYLHVNKCIKEKSGSYAKIVDGDYLEIWNFGQFLFFVFVFSCIFYLL